MMGRMLARVVFDEWIGAADGRATLWNKTLISAWGWKVDLHCMVGADDPGCFHTHPAWALRIVLAGGYVEELEDGESLAWPPGHFGLVRPSLSHRIARLLNDDRSFSLWVRAPKSAAIELRGPGWPDRGGA